MSNWSWKGFEPGRYYDICKNACREIKVTTKENEGLPFEALAETGSDFSIESPLK